MSKHNIPLYVFDNPFFDCMEKLILLFLHSLGDLEKGVFVSYSELSSACGVS